MSDQLHSRLKTALKRYFYRRNLTRFTLSLLSALTGLAGFIISFALLHLGVIEMWIRYPVAVIGAYGFFLGLIRVWAEFEKSRFDPHAVEIQEAIQRITPPNGPQTDAEERITYRSSGKGSSWIDWLDLGEVFVDLEAFPAIVACAIIGLLATLIVTLLFSVTNIPSLLADGFLDTFLVVGLYRRLRIAAKEHWLGTTIRKTWRTVIIIAGILAFAGWVLQFNAPECHSIGPAIKHLIKSPC